MPEKNESTEWVQMNLDLRKLRFKKESRFKRDCCYNWFSGTQVVWFKKDFLRPNARFKKEKFPKMLKNRDFLTILEQFQKKHQIF